MNKFILLLCSMAVSGIADPGTLTIEQALELARINSPDLRAAELNAQATMKDVDAAGMWRNPELKFEGENMGGELDLFSEGEYTLKVEQEFQRGGKQGKERDVALKSVGVANYARSEKALQLATEVRLAFSAVMAQQEIGKVRQKQEELGRAFVTVAKRRHEAGGGSELDVVQAELLLEEIILSQTCCFGDLAAAQERLAALIGLPKAELKELSAPYYELETLDGAVLDDTHPAILRLAASADVERALAQQAKAEDVSNFSLGAGYRYQAEDEINTFMFTASMPLGFHKRGRAVYAAGMLRADAMEAERDEARRKLQQELASILAVYNGAKLEAELTNTMLLPKAEQAYELSRAGYDAGRFSWLELIAAQQHLAEIRIRHIEALRGAHEARAELSTYLNEGFQP